MLSSRLDYRGLKSEAAAASLVAGQRVLVLASRDDDENAAENEVIYTALPAGVVRGLKIYDAGGHGTRLLESHPELMKIILAFISGS